jgi:hypothetical protein
MASKTLGVENKHDTGSKQWTCLFLLHRRRAISVILVLSVIQGMQVGLFTWVATVMNGSLVLRKVVVLSELSEHALQSVHLP